MTALTLAPAGSIEKEENYYRAISEITVFKHREHLIKELLSYMADLISTVEESNARLKDYAANLEQSEAKIRSIFNAAADGILTFDERGTIDSANPAACRIFGYTEAQLVGSSANQLVVNPAEGKFLESPTARKIGTGHEDKGRRSDGTEFPVFVAVEPMSSGEKQMYTAIVRDIADQKSAEQVLAQAKAKEETDKILNAIDQGLFLLYREGKRFRIGGQYSRAAERVLGVGDLGGRDFLSTLAGRIPEAPLKSAESYLDLMFKESVHAGSLKDLNPLADVAVTVTSEEEIRTMNLEFTFSRVLKEGRIEHLMATVMDVTESKQLREQLRENEQKAQTQMERLFRILHIDPAMLAEFIEETRLDLAVVDALLRKETEETALTGQLETMFRSVHKVKGNADLLGLSFYAEKLHGFEDAIARTLKKPDGAKASDFLPLLFAFNEVTAALEDIQELVSRLLDFHTRFGPSTGAEEDSMVRTLQALVSRLSQEMGKPVRLDVSAFEAAHINSAYRRYIKNILIQLLKNSMAHGIEDAESRARSGKPPEAVIVLSLEKMENALEIKLRDDGRGLSLPGLKAQAVKTGRWTAAELDAWPPGKVAALIYESGVSSRTEADIHSGRGVGMGMIRDTVKEIEGTMKIASSPGRFFEVQIRIPEK
jgi:two-component system chemotaxis sensor kinase CheA